MWWGSMRELAKEARGCKQRSRPLNPLLSMKRRAYSNEDGKVDDPWVTLKGLRASRMGAAAHAARGPEPNSPSGPDRLGH